MSQTSQPDTTGGLPELPIDVLLNVFDGCDVADILSVASVSKQNRIHRQNLTLVHGTRLARSFVQLQKNATYGLPSSSGAARHFDKLHSIPEQRI